MLSQLDDLWRHHRRAASSTGFVKTFDAFLTIFVHTPQNTALGDAKSFDDLRLFAGALDTQLCRIHAKGSQIPFAMLEYGLRAAEVRPLSILSDDADQITDPRGIFSNQWQ